jgi:hypothetical protein
MMEYTVRQKVAIATLCNKATRIWIHSEVLPVIRHTYIPPQTSNTKMSPKLRLSLGDRYKPANLHLATQPLSTGPNEEMDQNCARSILRKFLAELL